jgi:hypothetical protein
MRKTTTTAGGDRWERASLLCRTGGTSFQHITSRRKCAQAVHGIFDYFAEEHVTNRESHVMREYETEVKHGSPRDED